MIDFKRSKEIFLNIHPSEDLANKVEKYIKENKKKIKFFLFICNKKHWEVTLKQEPMMKLSLVYAFLPTIYDKYKAKKISDEIFYDTMTDIKIWIDDHKARTGEDGLFELNWIMHHMNMSIFKIGRLQYQKCIWYFKPAKTRDGVKLDFGDKILNMHIPRGAKLDYDECVKSVDMAQEFFKEYFPEFPDNKYMCFSWLLYPGNKNFMPADSNILKFQSMFEIVVEKEDPQPTYLWLYGQKFKVSDLMKNKKETGNYGFIDKLPQKTSLQKSTVEYIKKGGKFGEGIGVIIK
ncbi:MAG: DUF5596 domain-containing protein [Clostridia bacterium]|nr:DUF5596 domain-containing protein [Clostridia bacterium]